MRFLKTLGNTKAHAVHLDASLASAAGSRFRLGCRGRGRSRLGSRRLFLSSGFLLSSRLRLLLLFGCSLLCLFLLRSFLSFLLWLFFGLLGRGVAFTRFQLEQRLTNLYSVLRVSKELSNGTCKRGVDGNVDFVSLNSSYFVVKFNKITDF